MIKLVVTDLDETFLRSDKTISPRTEAAFLALRAQGIKTAFATARGGTVGRLVPADLFDGRITLNGALACAEGAIPVYSRLLCVERARSWLVAADNAGMKATAEIGGRHYSNFDVSQVWPTITNYQRCVFGELTGEAEKLYAVVENPEQITVLEKALPPETYMTVSRDGLAQVMHAQATKAKAIAALAAHWGISLGEIAAFGDDLNDMDMLQQCGTGVAMGNALEAVKAAANFVCGTNNEDGQAKWIEDHILTENR